MKCETTFALFALSQIVLAVPHPWHQTTSEHVESYSQLSARDHEHLPISARAQAAEDMIGDEEKSFSRNEDLSNDNKRKILTDERALTQSASSRGVFLGPSVDWDASRKANRNEYDSEGYDDGDDYEDDDDDDDDDDNDNKKRKTKPGFFQRVKNWFKFGKKDLERE